MQSAHCGAGDVESEQRDGDDDGEDGRELHKLNKERECAALFGILHIISLIVHRM